VIKNAADYTTAPSFPRQEEQYRANNEGTFIHTEASVYPVHSWASAVIRWSRLQLGHTLTRISRWRKEHRRSNIGNLQRLLWLFQCKGSGKKGSSPRSPLPSNGMSTGLMRSAMETSAVPSAIDRSDFEDLYAMDLCRRLRVTFSVRTLDWRGRNGHCGDVKFRA